MLKEKPSTFLFKLNRRTLAEVFLGGNIRYEARISKSPNHLQRKFLYFCADSCKRKQTLKQAHESREPSFQSDLNASRKA